MDDLISRQAAIEALCNACSLDESSCEWRVTDGLCEEITALKNVPSATMYGYNIDHLMLIARVLEEKNIPPEDVADVVKDMRLVWNFVLEEFESSLKKSLLEQIPLTEPPKEK